MAMVGYARCSSLDQSVDIQIEQLKAAGCTIIRSEKKSGATTDGRTELATVLDFLREGDVLMVTRIDRLARSVADLQNIVKQLRERGATLKAGDMTFDNTAIGQLTLQILSCFAEFENSLRRERQAEGIRKAKAAGIYKGRPFTIDAKAVQALRSEGLGPAAIAKQLRVSRASVYRLSTPPEPGGAPTVTP